MVKQRVKEGRWELQGATWVDPDCNLSSGESLARQFIHGKNFYLKEFGVNVKTAWLPDTFGFPASLPQIMIQADCHYFLTTKMCCNQINSVPYNTFRWRGCDGATVLAHVPPINSAELRAWEQLEAQKRFKENAFLDNFIRLVGIGDGAGGASPS